MREFSAFYFENFRFEKETLKAYFMYSFDKAEFFEEEIDFSCDGFFLRRDCDKDILENFLFQIHLALGISYYKLFPTKILFVESGFLDERQLHFWKKFYQNGMGEFLFRNKIDPDGLFDFHNSSGKQFQKTKFASSEKSLVPLGGGKDSLVTIELLHEKKLSFETVVFGKMDSVKTEVSRQVGVKNLLIQRYMSQNLFKLNDMQYYNGHVPITGIIAFVLFAAAYMYNYKYIVMSNELSANEGNMNWKGLHINHQYSKSLEFEKDLQAYMEVYVTSEISYFSLLRGMYEYKIAEIFAQKCKKYFSSFASCNKNFFLYSQKTHAGNWCLNCEKCAFVFMILSGHLSKQELLEIFGENLYEKQELHQTFLDLLGIGQHKPFECVGTNEECVYSLLQYYEKNEKIGVLDDIFREKISPYFTQEEIYKLSKKFGKIYNKDIIPMSFKATIFG